MRAACQGSITASVSWFLSLRMTGIGCRSRESSDEDNVQFPRFQCGEAFGSKPGAPEIGAEDVCRRTTDGRRRGGCGLDNASWNALRALSLLHIAPAYEEGFESFCSVFSCSIARTLELGPACSVVIASAICSCRCASSFCSIGRKSKIRSSC